MYDRLTDGLTGVVPEAPEVAAFYTDLITAYPEATPGDDDSAPWASGLYVVPECVIVAISGSRSAVVAPVLVDLARRHGLITYDPQDATVHA